MELIDNPTLINVKNSVLDIAEMLKQDNNDTYLKLIDNWNTINSLFHDFNNNYSWPMRTRDFLKIFYLDEQYETVKSTIRRLKQKGLLKEVDYFVRGPGQKTDINEEGGKTILKNTQSIEGAKFLRKFGIHLHLKENFIYPIIIKYAVNGFDYSIKEYTIRNPHYRIDLYLKQSNLAIECDELGHEHE